MQPLVIGGISITIGWLIALIVLILAVLGVVGVIPFNGPFSFGLIGALAIARLT